MDMSQYRDLFVSESRNHIDAFSDLIVRQESQSSDPELVNNLFRHAHSLKGMAATMQLLAISRLAHKMEDLLSRVRGGEFSLTPDVADLLLEGSDTLRDMVALVEQGNGHLLVEATELTNRLITYTPNTDLPASDGASPQPEPETGVQDSPHNPRHTDTFKNIRIKTETLDHLVNITGELITTRHLLTERARACPGNGLEEPLKQLSTLLRDLRDEVFKARMLPFTYISERFPRLVRDLARAQHKEVHFSTEGRDIELDRSILEEIAEPLVHLLRNAVDHGMETPEERIAQGKPATGQITLSVVRDKDHAVISISDDGRGMDPATLVDHALKKGIITSQRAEKLSLHDALMLICTPGFSTAAQVSDVSGRGVGMDAVKTAVQNLGGNLLIESIKGSGTQFILTLPISISIIQALLVKCGDMTIAFPVNVVEQTLELTRDCITDDGGRKVCTHNDTTIPVMSLSRLVGQPLMKAGTERIPVVVTNINKNPAGLIVDQILGQQEIFVKPLGAPLSRLNHVTGGTVLGDGRIVFVMDMSMLK